ncbi:MMPL family transporter [Longirhabdus pacifica]|uniref:MMPL family transporter n=1 Tax=Longirhabdus pacifica TaxID=2305227 RepID=UPI0013E8EBE8|nr:MMPL family transporter [Longirhabdus pacifica]
MNVILKMKWPLVLMWVILALVLFITMPSLDDLVREKGQPQIPDGYVSKYGEQLNNEYESSNGQDVMDIVVVFHEEEGLSSEQIKDIETQVQQWKVDQENIGISSVLSHFDRPDLKEQFVSEDESTILVPLSIDKLNRTADEVRADVERYMQVGDLGTYLTGNELIIADQIKTSQEGVKKTEIFTVLFIIIVLVIVFRSVVTPIVSLLSVGLTYLVSLGVVAHLVDAFNFPFSTTTQTFLVLILFGIGTDYNILLFSRFKEELAKNESVKEAVKTTYRTAGKTILYSGIAIAIAFGILGFAQFSFFKASVAVAIAAIILILQLFTFMPFFMSIMGKFMFWPSKKAVGHGESRSWKSLGAFSVKRPIVSVIIILIIVGSVFFVYEGDVSFNSIDEVDQSYESIQAFRILSDQFTAGKSMPTTVLLSADEAMDSNEYLTIIESISASIDNIEGVKTVYGPTRPQGEVLEALYVTDQTSTLQDNLQLANDGIVEVSSGLSEAEQGLAQAPTEDFSSVDQLNEATKQVGQSLVLVNNALIEIEGGLNEGVAGAEQLVSGAASLKEGLQQTEQSIGQLSSSFQQIESSYVTLADNYVAMQEQMNAMQSLLTVMEQQADAVEEGHDLSNDESYIQLVSSMEQLKTMITQISSGLEQLNAQFALVNASLQQGNEGMESILQAQQSLIAGAEQLEQGASSLQAGLQQGSGGQRQVINNMTQINNGVKQIEQGQAALSDGLQQLEEQLGTLQDGLMQSTEGLNEISGGLSEANQYLGELAEAPSDEIYIPEALLEDEQFQLALDAYMSEDRSITKISVELEQDPYSFEAMEIIEQVQQTIDSQLAYYNMEQLEVGIAGVSAINHDLNIISQGDFTRTVILMLSAIFVILIVILREIWMPIFIIVSLILTYFTALTITELFIPDLLGLEGMNWAIPFYGFIMITALGVDYSIFIMMRYRESELNSPVEAMVDAMKKMGTVIISAAIILCGTFAAMYPSGVVVLVQIATIVIIGLMLLTFVLLPIVLPGLLSLTQKVFKK